MTTLTKLKEKANLLEIDLNMLTLMPMHGMKNKSKEVRVVCEKFQRSISEKNWVNCIVLLGEIEEFERYYRNWLIDRGEEEDDEALEKMHEYIVDLEIEIEKIKRGRGRGMPRRTREFIEIKESFVERLFKTEIFEQRGNLKDLSLQELEEALQDVEALKTDLGAMSRYLMDEIRQKIREGEEGKMKNIKINLKRKEGSQ